MNFKKPEQLFAFIAVLILLVTSIFWTVLSARLHLANADQLIDGYLFESWRTFQAAVFPGAHTFLLKWPLFAVAALFGSSDLIITLLTVVCALVPVAALVILLFKIERRPMVFGLWCLVLSSILLLVPAQPSPGTLLPVNFAMFTTRNIEYALYVLILVFLARTKRLYSRSAVLVVAGTALLVASDKLFAPLLLGTVLLALAFVGFKNRRNIPAIITTRPTKWLLVSAVGIVAALVLIKVVGLLGFGTIANPATASPYALVTNVKTIAEALAYGALGLLTLFGANPAYDHLALAGWPTAVKDSFGLSWLGYGLNALVLVGLIALTLRFIAAQLRAAIERSQATVVALLTLGSAVAMSAVYVLTEHYYPADSRYLAIWLFALVIAAAVQLRTLRFRRRYIMLASGLLLLTLPFSIAGSWQQYRASNQALGPQKAFQKDVVTQMNKFKVGTLVGNYWDVVPIRQQLNYQPAIVPLADCAAVQGGLTSTAWQHPTARGSVAYLINSAPAATGFPDCSPAQIEQQFGVPTRKIAVGPNEHVHSWLYIYNTGVKQLVYAHTKTSPPRLKTAATLQAPVNCTQGSVMTVVAHEDDDLLFTNPDLQRAIDAKKCITTVFLTTGDAGTGGPYAQARISGSEAAYSTMYNQKGKWTNARYLINGKLITVARLQGAPQLSLIYLQLPDGNVQGNGFESHNFESLAQLRNGAINAIASSDAQTTYTSQALVATLGTLMDIFSPSEVRTQGYSANLHDGDHSDHHATGYFTSRAFKNYKQTATLRSYIGYPGHKLAANVDGPDLKAKEAAFFAYGAHDGAVCDSVADCDDSTAYSFYLTRQYSRMVDSHVVPVPPMVQPTSKQVSPTMQRLTGTPNNGCAISSAPRSIQCTLRRP